MILLADMKFFRKRLPKPTNGEGAATPQEKKNTDKVEREGDSSVELDTRKTTARSLDSTTNDEKTKVSKPDKASEVVKDEDERERLHDPLPSDEGLQTHLIVEAQRKREEMASLKNAFVVNQQASYFCKATETRYDATIVGVHFDDGPDRPYYTVRFWRNEVENEEEGGESVVRRSVEKQTTPDRLERVDFDPEQTWRILNNYW